MSIAAAVAAIAVMRRMIALYGGLSVLYERLLIFFFAFARFLMRLCWISRWTNVMTLDYVER